MLDKTQITADFREIIADDPTVLVHKATPITGRRTAIKAAKLASDYGFIDEYQFSLKAILADFTAVPAAGDLVGVGNTQYRILTPVETDSAGVFVTLHLGGQSQ